jgi:dolichol-phosphate mannosyltransferase
VRDSRPSGKALVVVPTYIERDHISELVGRLFDAAGGRVDLLVIDDSSPDGTAEAVRALAATRADVNLIERPRKLGLGTAYVTGFLWGLERGYRVIVEMDADLSHDPIDIPRLLAAAAEGADLVVGSRYVPGGRIQNWGRFRRSLSRAANTYARLWLGYDVRDSTAGFRAYRAEILERIDLPALRSQGYAFQIEMTRRVHLLGGRIEEVPITFVERAIGASKMTLTIVVEALFNVARWGLADRLGRRRLHHFSSGMRKARRG